MTAMIMVIVVCLTIAVVAFFFGTKKKDASNVYRRPTGPMMASCGPLDIGAGVAILKVTCFGDVIDEVVSYGEVIGFAHSGKVVIRLCENRAIVRRVARRLRSTAQYPK